MLGTAASDRAGIRSDVIGYRTKAMMENHEGRLNLRTRTGQAQVGHKGVSIAMVLHTDA